MNVISVAQFMFVKSFYGHAEMIHSVWIMSAC